MSTGTFPGFGEDAPLDLGNVPAPTARGMVNRLTSGTFGAFADTLNRVKNCAAPVRLRGSSMTVDAATGTVLTAYSSTDAPLGELYVACGNRRADKCPACAEVYQRDTFEVIRTGLVGGKGVTESVKDRPLVFVTLTAPSFGHVHGNRKDGATERRCRPYGKGRCEHDRPTACYRVHTDADETLGAPLCPDCCDWTTAAIWQWHAPELWRRFTIQLRRSLAGSLGLSIKAFRDVASLQFAKVAEVQTRGLIHFHALIRLDGPDGPGSPSSLLDGRGDVAMLEDAVRDAVSKVKVTAPPVDGADVPRTLRFGAQVDVRRVRSTRLDGDALNSEQVAGYLAKYATKSTGHDPAAPRPHLRRLEDECRTLVARAARSCRTLGHLDGCGCPYERLRKWCHMLGFRGHFSTRSRSYSVTLGRLRRARARWQRWTTDAARRGEVLDTADLEARLLADDADEETTLVIRSWEMVACGWPQHGDKQLAIAAATRAREYAQWKAARRWAA